DWSSDVCSSDLELVGLKQPVNVEINQLIRLGVLQDLCLNERIIHGIARGHGQEPLPSPRPIMLPIPVLWIVEPGFGHPKPGDYVNSLPVLPRTNHHPRRDVRSAGQVKTP